MYVIGLSQRAAEAMKGAELESGLENFDKTFAAVERHVAAAEGNLPPLPAPGGEGTGRRSAGLLEDHGALISTYEIYLDLMTGEEWSRDWATAVDWLRATAAHKSNLSRLSPSQERREWDGTWEQGGAADVGRGGVGGPGVLAAPCGGQASSGAAGHPTAASLHGQLPRPQGCHRGEDRPLDSPDHSIHRRKFVLGCPRRSGGSLGQLGHPNHAANLGPGQTQQSIPGRHNTNHS